MPQEAAGAQDAERMGERLADIHHVPCGRLSKERLPSPAATRRAAPSIRRAHFLASTRVVHFPSYRSRCELQAGCVILVCHLPFLSTVRASCWHGRGE